MNESLRNFKLSIIIPCYNEIETIQELIFRVKSSPIHSKEIIIIDNCSTDGSFKYLQDSSERKKFRIFQNSNNLGFSGNTIELIKIVEIY